MEENSDMEKHHLFSEVRTTIRLIVRVLVPTVFLIGGLVLLGLRLPGWSLIFGLPMVVFGVVFLIYAYDEVVTNKVVEGGGGYWPCGKCRKLTLTKSGDDLDRVVCQTCKERH